MIGLALFPLAGYLFFLAALHFRRRPTVLSGTQDFLLLSAALFGLVTLGPGRLLIPMDVLVFWKFTSWAFWTMFYFVCAYMAARFRTHRRMIVYHCPISVFVPKLFELGRGLDPEARLEGNVLTLRGLGLQCTIDSDYRGGHIELREIGVYQDQQRWEVFQRGVNSLCRNLYVPPPGSALFFLGVGGLFTVYGLLFFDYPTLAESFVEYWMPT